MISQICFPSQPLIHKKGKWGSEGRNLQFLFASTDVPQTGITQLWKTFYKRYLGASGDAELPLLPLCRSSDRAGCTYGVGVQELRQGWVHLWCWGTGTLVKGQILPLWLQLQGGQPREGFPGHASYAPESVPHTGDAVPGRRDGELSHGEMQCSTVRKWAV